MSPWNLLIIHKIHTFFSRDSLTGLGADGAETALLDGEVGKGALPTGKARELLP